MAIWDIFIFQNYSLYIWNSNELDDDDNDPVKQHNFGVSGLR